MVASLLWLAFESGFEPFIVSLTTVLSLVGLSFKLSRDNEKRETLENGTNEGLKDTLELMNENNSYSPYTIAKLAQLMKLHKIGELERVFNAQEEPSFEFIEHFCITFGINKNWLIYGQGNPYDNPEQTNFDPLEYYSEIKDENPNRIYFIMNKSETGEVFILLELSDFKYKILQRTWHVSTHVGGGGRSQIYGLYKLILKLKDSSRSLKCGGRILAPEVFKKLRSGSVFPHTVLSRPSYENPWWDDFTDVFGKYPISPNYVEWYGKGFSYAQSVVRDKIEEEIGNKSMQQTADTATD